MFNDIPGQSFIGSNEDLNHLVEIEGRDWEGL